jgi:hypothetical protein
VTVAAIRSIGVTEHSPLGGSSAKRWIGCPGSVSLQRLVGIGPGEEEESEYAAEGTRAHEAAALCLREDKDAWEVLPEEAANLQTYLDYCRSKIGPNGVWIEAPVASPDDHKSLYGTVDFATETEDGMVYVVDLKWGVGIVVEPKDNPQLMYYAYALMQQPGWTRDVEFPVELVIVQPRATHSGGPIRRWRTTNFHILEWGEKVLIPAMKRAEVSTSLKPSSECRFCPLRSFCPALKGMAKAAAEADPASVARMTDEELGREYINIEPVQIYLKAIREEAYRRLMDGKEPLGTCLVEQRSVRVWKDGTEAEIVAAFGDDAYEPRKLRTPPQLEKLGDKAKKIVAKHAYMPHNGYTVGLISDGKPAVKIQSSFANRKVTNDG